MSFNNTSPTALLVRFTVSINMMIAKEVVQKEAVLANPKNTFPAYSWRD